MRCALCSRQLQKPGQLRSVNDIKTAIAFCASFLYSCHEHSDQTFSGPSFAADGDRIQEALLHM